MYVEDVELCRRLEEQGRALYYVPDAVMVHEGGVSSRPRAGELGEMLERHREEYVRRTMGRLRAAPGNRRDACSARRLAPVRNRMLGSSAGGPARPDVLTDERSASG